MFRITATVLLICSIISLSYAQDSTKKTIPVKPNPLYKPHRYHTYKYHAKADSVKYRSKADSVSAKNTALQTPVKPDTTVPAPAVLDKSLNGQYQYLLTKVYHYQQPLISALWKSASDTLNANRLKLKTAQSALNSQNKTIDSLKAEVNNKNQDLSSARTDGVEILGILISKTTYNLIVWGLVAALAVTTVVVIARTGSFKHEAREKAELYSELEEEYKAFKIKANDKEKKLARELQTERNKLDELLGR
jgi:hypothetical protein